MAQTGAERAKRWRNRRRMDRGDAPAGGIPQVVVSSENSLRFYPTYGVHLAPDLEVVPDDVYLGKRNEMTYSGRECIQDCCSDASTNWMYQAVACLDDCHFPQSRDRRYWPNG